MAHARIQYHSGRPAEAVPALEEAAWARRRAGPPEEMDADPTTYFCELFVEMGDPQRAIAAGLASEAALAKAAAVFGTVPGARFATRRTMEMLAALANAYEAADEREKTWDYQERAVALCKEARMFPPQMISCWRRLARVLWSMGQRATAETVLGYALFWYEQAVGNLGMGSTTLRPIVVPALRMLVDVRRAMGKDDEARALEQDLDETEAILDSLVTSALEELREEMQAGAGGGGGGGQSKKKKLTRKQQKRKAVQRRKAEARAVDEPAGAAAAVEDDEGNATASGEQEQELEKVAAAVASQLQIEVPWPQPQPQPEPEEPEECAICLNDLPAAGDDEGGAVLLACSHFFHAECLERWKDKCLEKGLRFTCAMCRATVAMAADARGPN